MKSIDPSSYYHDLLSGEERQVYHDIKKGLSSLSGSFQTARLDFAKLSEIYFLVRLDDPWIFYTDGFSIKYYDRSDSVIMEPKYLFKKKEIQEHTKALQSRIEKLTRPALSMSGSEAEKYVHDLICDTVRYDKLKKAYSHELIGPLFHGIGVCEGISKTAKVLLDRLGIPSVIALSDSAPEKGIKYRHTWNVVALEKGYAHLDVTFDETLSRCGIHRYDYFNLPDRDIFRDHEPVMYRMPECALPDEVYYKRSKMVLTTEERLDRELIKAAKKKKELLFQWKGSYFTREVLRRFCEMISERAGEAGVYPLISVNMPQAVMYVRFSAEQTGNEIDIEEANEGENYSSEEAV